MRKRVAFRDDNLKISVFTRSKAALHDAARSCGLARNGHTSLPSIVNIVVDLEIVHKVFAFEYNSFKVAMTASHKVTLNQTAGTRGLGADNRSTRKGFEGIIVILEIVDKVFAFKNDDFVAAMVASHKIALDQATWAYRQL